MEMESYSMSTDAMSPVPEAGSSPLLNGFPFGSFPRRGLKRRYYIPQTLPRPQSISTAADHNPRRRLKASSVLRMSMAIVSGPTPPGDGVIQAAFSTTRGWTSPTQV